MSFSNQYSLRVDIKRRLSSVVPTFKQGDNGVLKFEIFDNGKKYDLADYTYSEITFRLPSGQSIVGNPVLDLEGILTYSFTGVEMSEVGKIETVLSIYSGSQMVSIQPFTCFIYDSMKGEDLSYIGILQDLIAEVQILRTEVTEAVKELGSTLDEASKIKDEVKDLNITVTAQEQVREKNEAQRISNEDARISKENTRQINEQSRVQNEQTRNNNELSRQQSLADMNNIINEFKTTGAYQSGVQYKKNNQVEYNGRTYIALKDNINVPISDTTTWRLFAEKGSKGEKGDTGAALSILGKLTDASQLPPTGQAGNAYTVNGELWVWSENTKDWENVGYIKGEQGETGNSAYQLAVENGYVGTEEDWLKTLQARVTNFEYVIYPEFEGQTDITIPLSTFTQDDALLVVFNGTVIYPEVDYTVSANIIILKEPIKDYQKSSLFIKITKNIEIIKDVPTLDGGIITDGTITEDKFSQSLLDSFKLAITKDEFVSTEGQTVFNLTGKYVPNRNLLRVVVGGAEQFSLSNFTETSTTSFTLNSPLKAGIDVVAIYYSTVAPLTTDLENRVTIAENKLATAQSDLSSVSQSLTTHESKLASDVELGHVKVDGVTVEISPEGVISAKAKGELYQDTITKNEESNAIGYFTFAKNVKYGAIVFNADSSTGKLAVISTTGVEIGDTVILRNDATKSETTTTVADKDTTTITLADKSLAVGNVRMVYVPSNTAFYQQTAEGYVTMASGANSHAEGSQTIALGASSHSEGLRTTALGANSHAEGQNTRAEGNASHAEGLSTRAIGSASHAEGNGTKAVGDRSHAEGDRTTANGANSHAEGQICNANGANSHAEGYNTNASGEASHAEGFETFASGIFSHAQNLGTTASVNSSTAIGRYNKAMTGSASTISNADDAFVIGNGTNASGLANAFRVKFNGASYGLSAFNSTGADYAEYFEWLDGNATDEDRVGYVVTLDGDKIRKANATDSYILGVISANPSVIGDSHQDDWNNKYVTDDFGRIQYHYVDKEYKKLSEVKEDGEEVYETEIKKEYVQMLNPNWNSESEYIPREQRKEWDAVGLVGKLIIYDDGTCLPNSYAKVGEVEGTMTNSDEPTQFRVMSRINDQLIKVFVK